MCSWNGGKFKNFNNEFLNLHSKHFLMQWEIKLQTENIKGRSKVHQKNTLRKRALNFDQWKDFSENYKPMRI